MNSLHLMQLKHISDSLQEKIGMLLIVLTVGYCCCFPEKQTLPNTCALLYIVKHFKFWLKKEAFFNSLISALHT